MTKLSLPDDSRAEGLLARLDHGFGHFVADLPFSLHELASRNSTFTGASLSEAFEGPSTMNPGVTCTPWLFWELTREVEDDLFQEVALGGALVVLASVLLDHLTDGQAAEPGKTVLLHQALHEAGVAHLRAVLPIDSGFWGEFDRLGREHLAGLSAELSARANPDQLTFGCFLEMVPPKFSPIVITMGAFVFLLNRYDLLKPIESSIKNLAVASQLLDDMGDWEDDLRDRRLTYYLTQMAPVDSWLAAEWPTAPELQQRIDDSWLDIKHMSAVQEWLDRSIEDVAGVCCGGWVDYVLGYRTLAAEHLRRYKARHVLRIITPLVDAHAPGAQRSPDV